MEKQVLQLTNLTRKRKKWVEANRENEFEEGITNLLTELYPDNAHFIYELLQNAEDTGAQVVRFTLSNDGIQFEHNGTRLFNLKDVESITSIGVSTKRNEPTSIGKFGVGFKAVFAYTNTPEIHSGDFHFKIHNLVVPETVGGAVDSNSTSFYFPFDNPKKDSDKAVEEIERALKSLADSTLLFLNHIREIEYLLPNGDLGKLRRVDLDDKGTGQHISIQNSTPEGSESGTHWLRYRKDATVADEAGDTKTCQVAVAFQIKETAADPASEDAKKSGKSAKVKAEWSVVSCEPGHVAILLPADKETSNLRFHLHAPFASTVARDSVRDCSANEELRDALAQLATEALIDIRDRGLLTMSFLSVLPNEADGLTDFYEPIREEIVKAFREQDLLPTKSGVHLKAGGLYRGPSEISTIIEDNDLSLLTDYNPPLWAANAPQRGQREDRFLDSLSIDEWSWKELKAAIQRTGHDEEKRRELEKLLSDKADSWLIRFYALMESCHSETTNFLDRDPLSPAWRLLIGVRVVDAKESLSHVKPRDAFFPPKPADGERSKPAEVPARILVVKPEVYEKSRLGENTRKAARSFLERVGVREYDERAEIERRLDRYKTSGEKSVTETHYQDIRSFVSFLKKFPNEVELFKDAAFLVAIDDIKAKSFWTRAPGVFLDTPYYDTGLTELVTVHRNRRVSPCYLEHLSKNISREDLIFFLKAIGVRHDFKVERADARDNEKIRSRYAGYETNTKINVDWIIEDLEEYLSENRKSSSRLIWIAVTQAPRDVAVAKYRPNQQRVLETAESQLVQLLKSHAWIPDIHGTFHKPEDMTRDMLPQELPYDDRNGVLTAIGFEQKARQASEEFKTRDAEARKLGFESVDDIEEALKLLKAMREGRIHEISPEAANTGGPQSSEHSSSAPNGGQTTGREQSSANSEDPASGDVLKRISERIRQPVRQDVEDPTPEEPQDDDDYTPAPVDYDRRIARAEERNASEIARLEREQELLSKAGSLPRYSYGWFLALLELECLATEEKNANGKTISITFGRIERDGASPKTIVLKEPGRFIPQSIEEFSGVRVDLEFNDGRTGKFHVDSFTAKEFSLLGKLQSADELNGVDLTKVVAASIQVQNPSFLLQELMNRFRELGFEETRDMKATLTPNIEFVFGPPGTGKTTHLATNVLTLLMQAIGRCKVLVLTPTNKAADVLTTRVMDTMGSDTSYRDWLIRFGTSANERIENEGVWRDRSFNIEALDRSVTVTTIARFAYDGFSRDGGKLHEIDWDIIVIDEASMIPLVSIIYPLHQPKARRFIVAGDPFQIEPIVAVEQWKDENIYTLVGLNKPGAFANPCPEPHPYSVTNLETQYRSVPSIGEVFSQFTYNGILKHHRRTEQQRQLKLDHIAAKPLNLIKFPVSKFESIYRARRLSSGTPYQTYSALFTFEFVRWLAGQIQENNHDGATFRIGIIAPYRAQANLLSKLTDPQTEKPKNVEIQVGTIHGFQGDECDIIVAVLNPPPNISGSPQMFLNKQNILNVAISRARDYLFIVMPDADTADLGNLRKIARIENLVKKGNEYCEHHSHTIEELVLGNARYLEENTFSTGHQMVNVYLKPERYYEVRSDESAIDVQIHERT